MFVNTSELDILNALYSHPYTSQRALARQTGLSIGLVNQSLAALKDAGLLDPAYRMTPAAEKLAAERKPRQAVILAAGFGMRMIPINREVPKALLEIHGEPLIERQIRQLQAAGITRIAVVVGFMKERFEYLIDMFGVKLIVNPDYAAANNLISLHLAGEWLDNCYIVPCDLWFAENPFHSAETHSWYLVANAPDPGSGIRVNRKGELTLCRNRTECVRLIGLAYLTGEDSASVRNTLATMAADPSFRDSFWDSEVPPCPAIRCICP